MSRKASGLLIEEDMSELSAGNPAPDFTLPSTTGDIRGSDLWADSKVIVAFYTEDGTPLCQNELKSFADDLPVFEELGAKVVAISSDSLDSHSRFALNLGGVPYPLASDADLKVAREYGVADETTKRSRRAIFVVEQGGTLLHVNPWYSPGNPSQYEEIVRALGFEG
jgi:peroxiredoxin Q/BCP